MNSPLRYLVLSVVALSASCDNQASDPVGPRGSGEVTPVLSVLTAPALLLDSHALYYCYHPGSTRNCVVLQRTLRIRSSIVPVNWTASKNQPWIALSATSGTTPASLTISVKTTVGYQPFGSSAFGTVTITAAGARYSPQKVEVVVNYFAAASSPPLLAFSDSAIGLCFYPSSRGCVKTERPLHQHRSIVGLARGEQRALDRPSPYQRSNPDHGSGGRGPHQGGGQDRHQRERGDHRLGGRGAEQPADDPGEAAVLQLAAPAVARSDSDRERGPLLGPHGRLRTHTGC